MKAREIMTPNVITASPDTPVEQLASIMVEKRISALPIVTADKHLVGIITESDLLHRSETGTERKRKWWLEMFVDSDTRAREYVKSHAAKAVDIMSRVVISVPADAELGEVADLLDAHKIRRVPVVDGHDLVGIISRADLVRAVVAQKARVDGVELENGALHKKIFDEIRKQQWINATYMAFTVDKGVVELRGFVESEDQHQALRVLVENVPGVKKVVDQLRRRNWQAAG